MPLEKQTRHRAPDGWLSRQKENAFGWSVYAVWFALYGIAWWIFKDLKQP